MATGLLLSLSPTPLASPDRPPEAPMPPVHPRPVSRAGPIAPAVPFRLICPAFPVAGMPSIRIKQASKRRTGVVCYAAPLSPHTLQWISAASIAVLLFGQGTAIHKSFLLPLFALQAPSSVISWIKGDYGTWTAFLALLVRIFYYLPGQLELPFLAMMLVIVAPYQTLNLRSTQSGAIVSLAIASYLAFQHFSRVGSLRNAFDQGSIIATLAIIFLTIIPCLFLL
ncbi:cold-regulated 413 inner membrane protein 1, chloroplastic-like [Curcuma longa]|uniref:cold-regulated 413 inner membrane protein 1, chloroplastic-like n=1 Tax=Curcuma longa TaxID=136217 RepID=UPI003D9EA519